jgi:hypothetical protein
MPEAERAQRLERIPPEMRKLVEQRLEIWTILPPPLAQEVLDNEPVARIFVLSRKATPADLKEVLQDMPPSRRRELEAGIARWQEMPEHQRSQICSQFSQFFDLTPEEKERALDTLSDAERRQMEKTLQEFEKLPKNQRELCIQSFQKFAGMSLAERELFLKNAKRWNEMLPTERQLWRELVVQVPNYPPPPPGF